jgi:SAM-dependent methyltransferase
LPLPPVGLRAGGGHFREDAAFLASAVEEARHVVDQRVSHEPLSLLDLGCGAGRLAYGLIAIDAPIARYEGVDVMAPPIDWCNATIRPANHAYRFRTTDVYNARYNPVGAHPAAAVTLPFEDGAFDVAYAYSVFSHMLTGDVRAYLAEFARVLSPDGVAVITAFVEDDVPDQAVNPPGYQGIVWGGALHCVRFSRAHFEAVAGDAGLRIAGFEHGRATDGQSRILLRRAAPGAG